jgi:hypothetical protein
MSDFTDGLDELLGLKQRQDAPAEAEALEAVPGQQQLPDDPAGEFDPEPGEPGPEGAPPRERDAFTAMLDDALASEGVDVGLELRRRFDPTKGNTSTHEWEMKREVLFSGEKYKFCCKRCLKWLSVGGDQTMAEALIEQGVDSNCANQVVTDINEA